MSANKKATARRVNKARLMWQGEIHERLSYTKAMPHFRRVAVIDVKPDALINRVARSIDVERNDEGKGCGYEKLAADILADLGIIKRNYFGIPASKVRKAGGAG
jgi:hypothetical protein